MDYIERIAEKIIPIALLGIIGALFTMYMDVQALKSTAIDYKNRADKAHEEYSKDTRSNREKLIVIETKLGY